MELSKLKKQRAVRLTRKNQSNVTDKSKAPLEEKSLNIPEDFVFK